MNLYSRIVRLDWWRHALRSLVALNDGPWRWSAGVQGTLAAGIPLAAFTLAGHQSQGLVAVLGAFTALYHAPMRLIDRSRALPLVAAGFVLAAAIGAGSSASLWTTVAGLVLVAALASALAFSVALGPPGPMMYVLVAGVSGHIAAPTHLGGAGTDRDDVVTLVAVGATSAYLIVVAPLLVPAVRRNSGSPASFRNLFPYTALDTVSRILVTRVLLAVTIASMVSIPLGVPHAYWVIMTAGVILQMGLTLRMPTVRAIQRVLGTILGVALFGLISMMDPSGIWVVVIVAVFQGAIEVVIARNYGLGLVMITPLALTISTAVGNTGILVVGMDRIIDTIFGAGIAMLTLFLTEWVRTVRS